MVTINLWLKKEIGCQAFRLRRINAAVAVAKGETCCRRAPIVIQNGKFHLNCGLNREKYRNFGAESDVLSALADVETNRRFAFPALPGIDQRNGILGFQTTQMFG